MPNPSGIILTVLLVFRSDRLLSKPCSDFSAISSKEATMVLTITLPDRYGYVILGNVVLPFFVGLYMSTSVCIPGGKSKRLFFRTAPCS
jgi:hypothetical protein